MHALDIETLDKDFLIEELKNIAQAKDLLSYLQKLPAVEVAEIIEELPEDIIPQIFELFTIEQQASIFTDFNYEIQMLLFNKLDKRAFAKMFENIESAERADFFQKIDKEDQILLLPYLDKQTLDNVIHLSSYPPETAGGIMSSDFATIHHNMSVKEAIDKIRKDASSKKMIYYCYAVDDNMNLQGYLTLKDLIMAELETPVSEILQTEYVFAEIDEDRESIAQKIEKYDLVAIPVINHQEQLVGIVRHDNAIEIIRSEHTEDMEKFMGITSHADDFDYEEITVFTHFKKRIIWLAILLVTGIISGFVIRHFSYAIEKIIILVLFIPMIAATGGNVGSQTASVIIRAMALGQINVSDWWKIIWKESRTSLLLGLSLGVVGFINVIIITRLSESINPIPLVNIGIVIAVALMAQVISASMIGAILPFIVKKIGGDPAIVASPAITTSVDITGLLIYFGIATMYFAL